MMIEQRLSSLLAPALRPARGRALAAASLLLAAASSACDAPDARDDAPEIPERDIDKAGPANGGGGTTFDANEIIEDAAMLDSTAFSVAEIDAFIADPYLDGGASCLVNERFGGRSAGALIHATATKYGLNPLFLLTHLQKESSLVGELGTCPSVALDEAFGCGCPDGSGCSPEFRGFENQLECAGELTRSYLDRLEAGQPTVSGWAVGRTKSTLDPRSITPRNMATAVLYTYTPWVGDRDAGGNPAPFGNNLFWRVWGQYARTLNYQVPTDGPPPVDPPPVDPPPADPPSGDALADWGYILDADFGLREDNIGAGYFRAPRTGGREHTGLDILGPHGAALRSPCDGEALTGSSFGGFGTWAQVVCPVEIAGETFWASSFYAHMSSSDVASSTRWTPVSKGEQIGQVGTSGNANGTNPHVHFEIVFHSSRSAAQGELHDSRDIATNAATERVLSLFQEHCFEPTGLDSDDPGPADGRNILRYGRNFDPFLALTCLGANKSPLKTPSSSLQRILVPWSRWYQAVTFDVDFGNL